MKNLLRLCLVVAGQTLASSAAQGQGCQAVPLPADQVAFRGLASVALHLNTTDFPDLSLVQSALSQAAMRINSSCLGNGLPSLYEGAQGESVTTVLFGHGVSPPSATQHCADGSIWHPPGVFGKTLVAQQNVLKIFEQYGCETAIQVTFAPGSPFENPLTLETLFIHELGHGYGLDHDNCAAGAMYVDGAVLFDGTLKDYLPEHCALMDTQVDRPECAAPFGEGDCPPQGTPPDDGKQGFCSAMPELCLPGDPGTWWSPTSSPGYSCVVEIVTVTSEFYNITTIRMVCDNVFRIPGDPEPERFSRGGPFLQVSTPSPSQTVSGTIAIQGTAAQPNRGVDKVTFWIDGQLVTLANFTRSLNASAFCESLPDPNCPNIGFSGNLDTRSLTNGPHVLSVVADEIRPLHPGTTAADIPFTVANSACTDTTAPTTTLTAPVNGSTVQGQVTMRAAASDNVRVSRVEFVLDGVVVGSDASSPYTYVWHTLTSVDGVHSIVARAYDACGNLGTSQQVIVTVANSCSDMTAPTVSIASPAAGSTVQASTSVRANFDDNVGVTKAEFYLDNVLQSSLNPPAGSTFSTWTWDTTTATNGSHTLKAKAYDACNNAATSANVGVTVNNPPPNPAPSMYFDYPSANSIVSGARVAIYGWATDADRVTSFVLKVDGAVVTATGGIVRLPRQDVCTAVPVGDPDCPNVGWRTIFDSTLFADGVHTVQMTGTDSRGASSTTQTTLKFVNSPVGTKRTFYPTEDTHVREDSPASNYGTLDYLSVRGAGTGRTRYALLKFNVTNVSGTVKSARLKLREDRGSVIPSLRLWKIISGTWSETTFTWNSIGSLTWAFEDVAFDLLGSTVTSIDVTDWIAGNGEVSIGLSCDQDAYYFISSREKSSISQRPVLEIVYQ